MYRHLFEHEQINTGGEDAASNYAQGHSRNVVEAVRQVLDCI
jgi:hypothetical protein